MKRHLLVAIVLITAYWSLLTSSSAQAPQFINYQGRLVQGTNLFNGNVGLALQLYNVPSGGAPLYQDSNTVTVVDGLYSTFIGDNPTSVVFVAALTNPAVYVQVVANGVSLTPRERLAAVAYSLATRGMRVGTNGIIVLNPVPGTNTIADSAGHSTIAGGLLNDIFAGAAQSFIGGGYDINIGSDAYGSAIAGGEFNDIFANAFYSFVGGGSNNRIGTNAWYSAIAGGQNNDIFASADHSFIGGGLGNSIRTNAISSVIAGGEFNVIFPSAPYSFIGCGRFNSIGTNAFFSFIPGGLRNTVGNHATNAFAAGRNAKANHPGSFVWGDCTAADVASTADNQVTFRASGGFRIFSNAGMTTGVVLAADSGAWTSISDVNAKEDFETVDTAEVLEKIAQLPITTWRYKGQDRAIRHMGPTAQDFAAAFALGDLPGAGITTVDADGVALAAIQALAKENAEMRSQNSEFRSQNAEMKAEIEAIKARLNAMEVR